MLVKTEKQSKWSTPGIITSSHSPGRTYLVQTPKGEIRRNRVHLQTVPEFNPEIIEQNDILDHDVPRSQSTPEQDQTISLSSDTPQSAACVPRRSSRTSRRPNRYIEQCNGIVYDT